MRIAAASASIGQTFNKIGLHPDWGGTYFLPRLIGTGRALELVFSGEMIGAEEALRIGLFNRVVGDDAVIAETLALARNLALKPPLAVATAKRSIRDSHQRSLQDALQLETEQHCGSSRARTHGKESRLFLRSELPCIGASNDSVDEEAAVRHVVVVGAGTMGRGIAQVAAVAGITTFLVDVEDAALMRARALIQETLAGSVKRRKLTSLEAEAAFGRIRSTTTLVEAVPGAELVVEAIAESLAAKCTLFSKLDALADSDALLATNTSSLSVASIASATRSPDRVVGMHFFNPVHIMKLVEVVAHVGASSLSIERAKDLSRLMGKHPIVVRDSPGFASSRLGSHWV